MITGLIVGVVYLLMFPEVWTDAREWLRDAAHVDTDGLNSSVNFSRVDYERDLEDRVLGLNATNAELLAENDRLRGELAAHRWRGVKTVFILLIVAGLLAFVLWLVLVKLALLRGGKLTVPEWELMAGEYLVKNKNRGVLDEYTQVMSIGSCYTQVVERSPRMPRMAYFTVFCLNPVLERSHWRNWPQADIVTVACHRDDPMGTISIYPELDIDEAITHHLKKLKSQGYDLLKSEVDDNPLNGILSTGARVRTTVEAGGDDVDAGDDKSSKKGEKK